MVRVLSLFVAKVMGATVSGIVHLVHVRVRVSLGGNHKNHSIPTTNIILGGPTFQKHEILHSDRKAVALLEEG